MGIVGALICAAALAAGSFWLLCLGTLVWGVYNAYGQYYRFAAADVASADFKATAISLVLAGGLVGGILGPTLSRFTVDLLGPKFIGAYLALIGFALHGDRAAALHPHPGPTAAEQRPRAAGRSREIAAQPKFIVAVLPARSATA